MFSISLRQDFICHHSFPNSVSSERFRHSHPYKIELTLLGDGLGEDGFLVDMERMGAILDEVVSQIDGAYLNDPPEFQARNPSLENFYRVIWTWVAERLKEPHVERMKVTVWESDDAQASYEQVM